MTTVFQTNQRLQILPWRPENVPLGILIRSERSSPLYGIVWAMTPLWQLISMLCADAINYKNIALRKEAGPLPDLASWTQRTMIVNNRFRASRSVYNSWQHRRWNDGLLGWDAYDVFTFCGLPGLIDHFLCSQSVDSLILEIEILHQFISADHKPMHTCTLFNNLHENLVDSRV